MSQLLTHHLHSYLVKGLLPSPPLLSFLPFRFHIYLWNGIFFSLAFDSHQINYLKFGGERLKSCSPLHTSIRATIPPPTHTGDDAAHVASVSHSVDCSASLHSITTVPPSTHTHNAHVPLECCQWVVMSTVPPTLVPHLSYRPWTSGGQLQLVGKRLRWVCSSHMTFHQSSLATLYHTHQLSVVIVEDPPLSLIARDSTRSRQLWWI